MKIRDNKGSITIFVLVGLLFMTSFLIISFGSNVNKSKTAKEQFNIISGIYSKNDGDENAYQRAYAAIRKVNKQTMTDSSVNSSTLELTKTFQGNLSNYRIYGNSVQSTEPSPTNPVEIQSVGDTVNLFDINNPKYTASSQYNLGYKVKIENEIMYNAGVYGGSDGACTYIEKPEGAQYLTLSFETDDGPEVATTGIMIRFYYFNEIDSITGIPTDLVPGGFFTYLKGYNKFTTIDCSSYKYVGFCLVGLQKHSISFKNIQLEVGKVATEYMPYGKYKVPVKVSGKNLFNANEIKNSNVQVKDNGKTIVMPIVTSGNGYTSLRTTLSKLCPNLKVGDQAVLSFKSNTSTNPIIWLEGAAILWDKNSTKTITQKMLDSQVVFYGNRYEDGDTVQKIITDFQLEIGAVATEYAPYIEPMTTNIYLNQPLRKVGDKGDYIDFATGKVIRYVEERTFTGNESVWSRWSGSVTANSMGAYFYNYNELGNYGNPIFEGEMGMSTHFGNGADKLASADDSLVGKMYIASNSNPPYISFKVPYTELETWKGFLDSEYKSGNPLRVYYQLLVPDDTETVELPQLKSLEDYTKIEVLTEVTPSKIEAEYTGYTLE